MLNTRVKSAVLLSSLVLGGCTPVQKITNFFTMGRCPSTHGRTLYRGGQIIGDGKGGLGSIQLERDAVVTDVGYHSYSVSVGRTNYIADDGEINIGQWEAMTATDPEVIVRTEGAYSKYGMSAEPPFPEHLYACVDKDGTIGLGEETLFPKNTQEVNKTWFEKHVVSTIKNAENELEARKYMGGGRERAG